MMVKDLGAAGSFYYTLYTYTVYIYFMYTVWFIICGILQSIISMLVFREVMDMVFIGRNDNGSLYSNKG